MARPRLISDDQILGMMRTCVLEHGPAVSLDTVAERLHVTGPALLKRFGTRKELLLRALRPPDDPPILTDLANGPDSRSLEDQLVSHFSRAWDFFAEVIPCISALRESGVTHQEIMNNGTIAPARLVSAVTGWLKQAKNQGLVESKTLESVATAMLGALQVRVFTAHVLRDPESARSQREYIRDIARLFARALLPPMGSKPRVAQAR